MRKHLNSHAIVRRDRDSHVAIWLAAPLALSLSLFSACGSDKDTSDGETCQAPKVWRYQTPGCGAEAHPVCGSSSQDAGLGFACGCEGEILEGFDYFQKPWSARGICPDICNSPSHITESFLAPIKGCPCNPATDDPACVSAFGGMHPMTCVSGLWELDRYATCTDTQADGGAMDDGGAVTD